MGLFSYMNQLMLLLASQSMKCFVTIGTLVKDCSCMYQFMSFLASKLSESFIAIATFMRVFSCMN